MQFCLFEDSNASAFHPLTLTRPLWDLRSGILTIKEKWEAETRLPIRKWHIAEHLRKLFPSNNAPTGSDCVWVNSSVFPAPEILEKMYNLKRYEGLRFEGRWVAVKIKETDSVDVLLSSGKISGHELNAARVLSCFSDLLNRNASEIEADIRRLNPAAQKKEWRGVYVQDPENILIHESARIEPGVIIIAEDGPVFIDENVTIQANSVLRGPVAICKGATVNALSRVSASSTIGPSCKVGGEVSHSILHSYSNKGHDGFLGHSILGQWVNLGADTNTSNLKNNYSTVKLTDWESEAVYDSGVQFFGSVLADHTKTAINTQLNTGTICGVAANIFCSGFPNKYIPSFAWLGDSGIETYAIGKALETMRVVMARRNVELSAAYEALIKHLHDSA